MAGLSKAPRWRPSSLAASFPNDKKLDAETRRTQRTALRSAEDLALFSVGGGFGGGMHAVLGDFVDAAGGGLDALAIEMIERNAAFADGIALLDPFGDVGLRQGSGLEQSAACAERSGKRRA